MVGGKFEQTIAFVLVTISMVSAIYTENQIVDIVQDLFYYEDLDMYPETGSLEIKDLFLEFVQKYHKEYISLEEIRLRYELFKLKVKRDGHYDETSDLTTKEKDAKEDGHNDVGPRKYHDYNYNDEYEEMYYDQERSDDKKITKEPFVIVQGRNLNTEQKASQGVQEVQIEMGTNNIKVSSLKEPIQLIFNNCTVLIRSPEDFSSKIGLPKLGDKSFGKDPLFDEMESLNNKMIETKATKSIGQTSEELNDYLQNFTKLTWYSLTSTETNLILKNEDRTSSYLKESVQDSTQAAIIENTEDDQRIMQKINGLTTPKQQNQNGPLLDNTTPTYITNYNKTISPTNNTADKQSIRHRTFEGIIDKQVNYKKAGSTTQGIVITGDKEKETEDEDNDNENEIGKITGTERENQYKSNENEKDEENESDNENETDDDISETRRNPQDRSILKDNLHNLPQYINKKIIKSKYPKFYNIYNINSSVVQI